MIYANTTLRSGSLVSGTASQHVVTAVSVDSFKNRLDKFWANEEASFDYKANFYLAVVLQDASKSYVAFLLLCTIV